MPKLSEGKAVAIAVVFNFAQTSSIINLNHWNSNFYEVSFSRLLFLEAATAAASFIFAVTKIKKK